MKKSILFIFLTLLTSPLFVQAQAPTTDTTKIYFTPAKSEKVTDNRYRFYGTIDTAKHTETTPIKLSEIVIEGGIYPVGKTDIADRLWPLTTASYTKGIDSEGKYVFEVINIPFNQNTTYDIWMTFKKGTDGVIYDSNKNKSEFRTSTGIIPETGKARENFINKNSYRLLAPIPGMTMLLDPELCKLEQEKNPGEICDINAFLNFLLQLAIGAAAVVLVVRIIIDGYGYMISDMPFVKAKLKGRFIDAMIGLVIALSSYLILNTVSPRLVNNDIRIGEVAFDVKEYPALDNATYQQITGKSILPKSQYVALAQGIAREVGIDECLLIATVTAESNWRASVMGSDADFALDIPSRRAFINSGIKYSGATFKKGDMTLLKDKAFKNDTPKGKVDWRFSAGFGLLGITFFPAPYFKPGYETSVPYSIKDIVPELDNSAWPKNPKTNKSYTPVELLDGETSLRLGATLLKKKLEQCKDPYTTLYSWNKGSCSSSSIGGEHRKKAYDQCKGIK